MGEKCNQIIFFFKLNGKIWDRKELFNIPGTIFLVGNALLCVFLPGNAISRNAPHSETISCKFLLTTANFIFFRVYWLNRGKNNRVFRRKRRQGLLVNFYPSGWFFVCITVIFGVRRLQFLLKTVLSYLQVCSKFHQNLS